MTQRAPRELGEARCTRRTAITALGASALGVAIGSCSRPRGGEVILYSSVDDFVLREVVQAFEAWSGVRVRLLGDTEATKTTGLIERLIAERDSPRADVWWSSEPFGTIRLAGLGLLEPLAIEPAPVVAPEFAGRLGAADGTWFGFGMRARVIAVREDRFDAERQPRRLPDLARPDLRGRCGMARPRFGTTRGHMAALLAHHGEHAFGAWLDALRDNRIRIYEGNSAIVRAIADGEIDAGLTDSDDVWGARRNGWPVVALFEPRDVPEEVGALPSPGPMLIPNTVARVRGGPHAANARRLVEFLLNGPAEEIMAASDSHNMPTRHGPFPDLAPFEIPGGWLPDLEAAAAADERAMVLCDQAFGRP